MHWRSFLARYLPLQFLGFFAACGYAADPEEIEPPLKYLLIVDGNPLAITENKPIRLEGEFKSPEISLAVDPHRIFTYGGITFRYPRNFTYKADLSDKDARMWTLSGSDAKVMVCDVDGDATLAEYAEAISDALGKKSLITLNPNLKTKLGKHTLAGHSVKITIGEIQLLMEIYRVGKGDGRTRLLVFQDLWTNGKHTKEGADTFALTKESFAITRP